MNDRRGAEQKKKDAWWQSFVLYVGLGAFHEASHVLVGSWFGYAWKVREEDSSAVSALVEGLLFRNIELVPQNGQSGSSSEEEALFWIRHAGWMASLALAALLWSISRSKHQKLLDTAVRVAWLTVVDALWTDLLQCSPLLPLLPLREASSIFFFCGNFGLILLHPTWLLQDQGRAALDVLETMVRVTMMRGAQGGGVVTYHPTLYSPQTKDLKAIRTRVVNRKRTDLSKKIREQVQRDIIGYSPLLGTTYIARRYPENFVPILSGHTRFATSSISTLDGVHPHIWSAPVHRPIWDVYSLGRGPRTRRVEHYVTHNGDYDFYVLHGTSVELGTIQGWLVAVTHTPLPTTVDSCAVAGTMDTLRTQGSMALSARYALAMGMPQCTMFEFGVDEDVHSSPFPPPSYWNRLGRMLDAQLRKFAKKNPSQTSYLLTHVNERLPLAKQMSLAIKEDDALLDPLLHYMDFMARMQDPDDSRVGGDPEMGGGNTMIDFCMTTLGAFFENDLFFACKTFLKHAKGSFGIVFSSSLDSDRQICIAAQGQSMSIAFYPKKGLVCFGSELAAVKAGLNHEMPGGGTFKASVEPTSEMDKAAYRLELDDLGGEIVLLDWNTDSKRPPVFQLQPGLDSADSSKSSELATFTLMKNRLKVVSHRQDVDKLMGKPDDLFHRLVQLTDNNLVKAIDSDHKDLVRKDLNDIPRVCRDIQNEFRSARGGGSLNRLTAFNLSSCLRKRLEAKLKGSHVDSIDILVTGCEVSLWLGEQFASDLKKAFPKLDVQAMSSNKILGLFGQDVSIPSLGFSYSHKTCDLRDTIIIIVSQSGGTFSPMHCSNLLQSSTNNLFVVTSEWDTQIGKQLRDIDNISDGFDKLFHCRIFTTECGMRPAEPSSVSVVATQQLLTNLFEYISAVILSNNKYRNLLGTWCDFPPDIVNLEANSLEKSSDAVITEQDLEILERLNNTNISALSEIVGTNARGYDLDLAESEGTESNLRAIGDLWADHVLENAKAYMMSFVYIFATVIAGYPIAVAIAVGCGLAYDSVWMHLVRVVDAAIYFWLPQINITILRLVQRRNLLHRMTQRTVAIGDIPWVAQAAEAFLSKLFAVSYSIAGIHVLSGNASDHLVHRHTHRIVRGSLVIVGRPDGRLSQLSTVEASACLAVNQASSIQSWGGTCESITIGHNPFKLPLTKAAIILPTKRPLFMCERLLVEFDNEGKEIDLDMDNLASMVGSKERRGSFFALFQRKSFNSQSSGGLQGSLHNYGSLHKIFRKSTRMLDVSRRSDHDMSVESRSDHGTDTTPVRDPPRLDSKQAKTRSANALVGAYNNLKEKAAKTGSSRNSGAAGRSSSRRKQAPGHGAQSKRSSLIALQTMQGRSRRSVVGRRSVAMARRSVARLSVSGRSGFSSRMSVSLSSSKRSSKDSSDLLSLEDDLDVGIEDSVTLDSVLESAIVRRQFSDKTKKLFELLDKDGDGVVTIQEFVDGAELLNTDMPREDLLRLFKSADRDRSGALDIKEIGHLLEKYSLGEALVLPQSTRNQQGAIEVRPSQEKYFGEALRKYNFKGQQGDKLQVDLNVAKSQSFAQELYETRIASMQRFVAMCVIFHQIAWRVQRFFEVISCGLWSYRMDRTHSIMRIATTASPVSGADVREQMRFMRLQKKVRHAINVISSAYLRYKANKESKRIQALEDQVLMMQKANSTRSLDPAKEEMKSIRIRQLESQVSRLTHDRNLGPLATSVSAVGQSEVSQLTTTPIKEEDERNSNQSNTSFLLQSLRPFLGGDDSSSTSSDVLMDNS